MSSKHIHSTSIKMNSKKSKKVNVDNVSPVNNNNKKKVKNVLNAEMENNIGMDKKEKKKEHTDSAPVEGKADVKVGRKRKQVDADTEFLTPKKSKKKVKPESNLHEFSTSSTTTDFNNAEFQTSGTPVLKKNKKKSKMTSTDTQAFVITDENGDSINILELPIQANGKTTGELDQIGQHSSFHLVDESRNYKVEVVDNNNAITNATDDSLKEDKVVHITIKDLEDTDSELNENDLLTVNKFESFKGSKQEMINWPKEDLKKLVDRMEACIPEHDVLAFSTRAEKLQWDAIAFKNYTVEDCKKMWLLLQKQIRRFRLLKEVLVDAKEWIQSPKTKSKKIPRHPDLPRKPLSAYFIYYVKKRDAFHKSHPGLDATEISKLMAQEFKALPPEKRLKYERMAAKQREEYDQQLEEFYQTHPDIPRVAKPQKTKQEKPPKPPKPPKPVKEKPAPKPPKERIPKRPPPPFQFFYMSELEREGATIEDKVAYKDICKERWRDMTDRKKLVWINYAETEYAKYEEAVQQYIRSHPDYSHNPHKPILTKEEIQIKERVAGKPTKPPGSAYNLFARMLLQSDEIKPVPVRDRLVYVSNKWKHCAEGEKKQYKDLSTQMNEKYKLELASYLETLPEEERKKELQKNVPKRKKPEDIVKKARPTKKRAERKSTAKKLQEPEQPPISAFKYFATLYTGEDPVAQAWKALTPEQKKIYEDELVKKKQAYIANFEKFLKSLTKDELEAFSNSRRRIKKDGEEDEDGDSSEESGTEDSEDDSNDQDDEVDEEDEEDK